MDVAPSGTTGMDVATIGVMKRTTEPSTTPRTSTKAASALRMTKPRATKSKTSTNVAEASATTLSESEIALRAYEIFKARNGEPGDPVSDWLQAERELRRAT
jgi:hypothetical protein